MENAKILQELAPIKAKMSQAETIATGLIIKTAEDMTRATDILSRVKNIGKEITERKESITKPLNEALRNARAFFAPFETQWENIERLVKSKMLAYQNAEMAKAAVKTEAIEKKVETGKMSFDKAADQIEAITPAKSVEAKTGSVQFRTIREVVIEDESKLPREYLIPDLPKIRKVALAGVEIAGVRVVDKQVVAGIAKQW